MRDDRPEQRESIWSVPSRWHGWYFLVFTVMAVLSTGYIGWEEYHNPENKGFYATFLAIVRNAGASIIFSAGFAVITVEVLGMIGDTFIRRRYLRQGRHQGREEGREDERRAWQAWNNRRKGAEARGEDFNEPPPGSP